MLPAERRDVGQPLTGDRLATPAQDVEGTGQVPGVPQGDGGNDEGEAARPMLLRFQASVTDAAKPVETYRPLQGVLGLAAMSFEESRWVRAEANSGARLHKSSV